MEPKPSHMDRRNAAAFLETAVAGSYKYRPRYPDQLISQLAEFAGGPNGGNVLDVGCGTGDIARPLAQLVCRVDAIDVSKAMIDEARTLLGGDNPRIAWTCSPVEFAELSPHYSLITAGESIRWFDWPVAFARFHQVLTPEGRLAIIKRTWGTGRPEELELFKRHSTNQEYQSVNLIDELRDRKLFELMGSLRFETLWKPTLGEYLEARHSQASFSRERMGPAAAAAFDQELESHLNDLFPSGVYELNISFTLWWGSVLGTSG